jgi:trehalose synthase-fused probable maltokinase
MSSEGRDDRAGALTELSARIAPWLPKARWFPGKDRAEASVRAIDLLEMPGTGALAVAIINCAGTVLVVPVDPLTGRDAASEPALAAAIATLALGGGAVTGLHGSLVGRPVEARPPDGLTPLPRVAFRAADLRVRPLGGDASNTSLVIEGAGAADGALVLKLLRQARPGIHPEVEFGRFFATATDWRGTPELCGWVEYIPVDPQGDRAAVATLHAFAPGCRSAWEVLVEWLADGGINGVNRERMLDVARRLGTVTAQMHRALASRDDLHDFAPEPATAAGRRALGHRLATHARTVFGASALAASPSSPALAPRLSRLSAKAPGICAELETLADAGTSAADIRVHGDYHLGQVLVDASAERVMPIDFEGEPTRPLDERRRKTSAAKDVAGMLRSFDYCAAHVARLHGLERGDPAPLVEAFLVAYRRGAAGARWWPADADEERRLLAAFTLDKAVYELAYELANRPDWVEVPLGALERLTGG